VTAVALVTNRSRLPALSDQPWFLSNAVVRVETKISRRRACIAASREDEFGRVRAGAEWVSASSIST